MIARWFRESARRGRSRTWVGPFELVVDPHDPAPHAAFAVPADGAAPARADFDALGAAFAAHGRAPRIHWVAEAAPEVGPAMVRAGFEVERWCAVLEAPVEALRAPPVPGFTVAPIVDWPEALEVQRAAFGAAELGARPVGGGGVAARLGPLVVAVAEHHPPVDGWSELVGVATAAAYRGRGLGGWVTVAAARASAAPIAVIVAATDDAARLYERLGFERVATVVHGGQRRLRNT